MMSLKLRSLVLILAVPCLLAAEDGFAQKKLYRWVDEHGNVTFSDQVPPDQVQHKRETLNDKAQVLDVVEKAATPDELARQKRLELLRKEQEKIIAKQAADDRVLLATYRTMDDMRRALDNKLALMDGKKNVMEANKQRFEQQLNQQQQQAAGFERNAQKVPEKLLKDIASTRQQIALTEQELQRHALEREKVEREFKADIARFEFLTQAGNDGKANQNKLMTGNLNSELGLFVCHDAAECEKAWKYAGEYVYKNATTGRDVDTDKLIMTAAPFNDNEFSLSVSKLEQGGVQQIFLDIRCKATNLGKELCASEKVYEIRRNFSAYLQALLTPQ